MHRHPIPMSAANWRVHCAQASGERLTLEVRAGSRQEAEVEACEQLALADLAKPQSIRIEGCERL